MFIVGSCNLKMNLNQLNISILIYSDFTWEKKCICWLFEGLKKKKKLHLNLKIPPTCLPQIQ